MDIGKRIRDIRIGKGISQEVLANELSVDKSLISLYENGSREISAARLALVAGILNAPIESFFREDYSIIPSLDGKELRELDEYDLQMNLLIPPKNVPLMTWLEVVASAIGGEDKYVLLEAMKIGCLITGQLWLSEDMDFPIEVDWQNKHDYKHYVNNIEINCSSRLDFNLLHNVLKCMAAGVMDVSPKLKMRVCDCLRYDISERIVQQFHKRPAFPTYIVPKIETYCSPMFSAESPKQKIEELEGTKFLFDDKETEIWLIKKGIELHRVANKAKYEKMILDNEQAKQTWITVYKEKAQKQARQKQLRKCPHVAVALRRHGISGEALLDNRPASILKKEQQLATSISSLLKKQTLQTI